MRKSSQRLEYYLLHVLLCVVTNSQTTGASSSFSAVTLRSVFLGNMSESFQEFQLPSDALRMLGLDRETLITCEIDKNGDTAIVIPGGTRLKVIFGETGTLFLNMTFTFDQNANLKMKDIADDPELVPLKPHPLEWGITGQACHLRRISVISNIGAIIKINGRVIRAPLGDEVGLRLVVINGRTCKVNFQKLFLTNSFGAYRDLIWVMKNIAPGRIVILASQAEGSYLLHVAARETISAFGSHFIKHYLHGDWWVWAFVMGGLSVGEVLLPNPGTMNNFGSPIMFEAKFSSAIRHPFDNWKAEECSSWPNNSTWSARRRFCEEQDAVRLLCDCDSPFQFRTQISYSNKTGFVPVLILCGPRLHPLFRLLISLSAQESLARDAITLVLDGESKDIRQLAFILGLRVIIHEPVGTGSIRVSRNLRFGLFNLLKVFPRAKAFIVLEDDLIVAQDFYSYMTQLSPIFDMDQTIYAVSGFNFLSTPTTSHDATITYRTESHPAYGWMMPKVIIQELLPKWPHKLYQHDWDYIVGSAMMRRGRHCIVPDVNRVYHNCMQDRSVHVTPSWFGERHFLRKGLNTLRDVQLRPLDRLVKDPYEAEMEKLISNATVLTVLNPYNITLPKPQIGSYVIFVEMKRQKDYSAFRVVADGLGTWTGSPLFGFYNYTWRLFYKSSPLIIVGCPISYFSRFMPEETRVFSVSVTEEHQIDRPEVVTMITHRTRVQNNTSKTSDKNYYCHRNLENDCTDLETLLKH